MAIDIDTRYYASNGIERIRIPDKETAVRLMEAGFKTREHRITSVVIYLEEN